MFEASVVDDKGLKLQWWMIMVFISKETEPVKITQDYIITELQKNKDNGQSNLVTHRKKSEDMQLLLKLSKRQLTSPFK